MRQLAILTVLCVGGLLQAAEIPDTIAGQAMTRWWEVLRSGDADQARAHYAAFATSFTSQVNEDAYVATCAQLGGLLANAELLAARSESEHYLSVWTKTMAGTMEVILGVVAEEPYLIETLLVRPGNPPSESTAMPAGSLAERLEWARREANFPAVAAAHSVGGEIRERAVVGIRKAGEEAKVEPDDAFHVGSLSKSMTASMLARLIERGQLGWATTVGSVLKEMPMLDAYRGVTLEQLMQHRGGIIKATGFGPVEMKKWTSLPGDETAQRKAYLEHALMQEPIYEPGAGHEYSNAGYALAAYVAEVVTGKSWSTLMREELFTPLGLKSAGFGWPAEVYGHTGSPADWTVVDDTLYDFGEFIDPAGDIHMHIDDLRRYGQAHLDGLNGKDGWLKAATVQRLHTPPEGQDYAAGWIVADADGAPMHWHNGSAGTFYALLSLLPESDQVVAFLFSSATRAEEMALTIGRELTD